MAAKKDWLYFSISLNVDEANNIIIPPIRIISLANSSTKTKNYFSIPSKKSNETFKTDDTIF